MVRSAGFEPAISVFSSLLIIAFLYEWLLQGGSTAPYAGIAQTGQVPVLAESLQFIADGNLANIANLQVSLGNQDLSLVVISNALNYTVYGADISAFAGQTEQLMFAALNAGGGNNWEIDNIQFSTSPIPEPDTLVLAAMGGLFLISRRWKRD